MLRLLFLSLVCFTVFAQEVEAPVKFDIFDFITKIPLMLGYLSTSLSALIGLFLLIPGQQPEKFLQKVVDIIEKFSKK